MNYTNTDIKTIDNWLKDNVCEERYEHSLGTMDMAAELAQMFNLDVEKAKTAGILHDCAKCLSNDELLKIIKEHLKNVEECELVNYKTLHAPVSAYLAEKNFGVTDNEILDAIRWHTLGHCDMTLFEKVIFLADKIEKNTRELPFRDECLELLNANKDEQGLDKALLLCFDRTIKSLVDRKLAICHVTIDVYNELLNSIGT